MYAVLAISGKVSLSSSRKCAINDVEIETNNGNPYMYPQPITETLHQDIAVHQFDHSKIQVTIII